MEMGWTDVGSGGYILVSCAHSNTSFYIKSYGSQAGENGSGYIFQTARWNFKCDLIPTGFFCLKTNILYIYNVYIVMCSIVLCVLI